MKDADMYWENEAGQRMTNERFMELWGDCIQDACCAGGWRKVYPISEAEAVNINQSFMQDFPTPQAYYDHFAWSEPIPWDQLSEEARAAWVGWWLRATGQTPTRTASPASVPRP